MFDIGFPNSWSSGSWPFWCSAPERLPKVARTTGHLLGRLQRYVSDVKSDINREMQSTSLKRLQEEARTSAMAFESSVRQRDRGRREQCQCLRGVGFVGGGRSREEPDVVVRLPRPSGARHRCCATGPSACRGGRPCRADAIVRDDATGRACHRAPGPAPGALLGFDFVPPSDPKNPKSRAPRKTAFSTSSNYATACCGRWWQWWRFSSA